MQLGGLEEEPISPAGHLGRLNGNHPLAVTASLGGSMGHPGKET